MNRFENYVKEIAHKLDFFIEWKNNIAYLFLKENRKLKIGVAILPMKKIYALNGEVLKYFPLEINVIPDDIKYMYVGI